MIESSLSIEIHAQTAKNVLARINNEAAEAFKHGRHLAYHIYTDPGRWESATEYKLTIHADYMWTFPGDPIPTGWTLVEPLAGPK